MQAPIMSAELLYHIRHVFLPPKLPQKDDAGASKSAALLEIVLEALITFQDYVSKERRSEWTPLVQMVKDMIDVRNDAGDLVPEKLEQILRVMSDDGMRFAPRLGRGRC